MNLTRREKWLWASLILALAGDTITTSYAIMVLGMTEQNPAMAIMFESIEPIPAMILTKTALLAVVYKLWDTREEDGWAAITGASLLTWVVVVANLYAIITF